MFYYKYLFFILVLITTFVSVRAKKSCPIQVELLENKMIKILNEDELCGCLEYKKSNVEASQKTVPCDLQMSTLDGKISFSATSVCGCIGYATNPVEEPFTYLKTNNTEKAVLYPTDTTFPDLETNDTASNPNKTELPFKSEISNIENTRLTLESLKNKNKETNETELLTVVIIENNLNTTNYTTEEFQTPKQDDDVSLTEKITPSSILFNFTEEYSTSFLDLPATLPALDTKLITNTSKPDNITAIDNLNSSKISFGTLKLNSESNKNLNYNNDTKYVSPAVPIMNSSIEKSKSLTFYPESENITEVRNMNSFVDAVNYSGLYKEENVSYTLKLSDEITPSSVVINFAKKQNVSNQDMFSTLGSFNNDLINSSFGEPNNFKKIKNSNNLEVGNSVTVFNSESKEDVSLIIDKYINSTAATVNVTTEKWDNSSLYLITKKYTQIQNFNNSIKTNFKENENKTTNKLDLDGKRNYDERFDDSLILLINSSDGKSTPFPLVQNFTTAIKPFTNIIKDINDNDDDNLPNKTSIEYEYERNDKNDQREYSFSLKSTLLSFLQEETTTSLLINQKVNPDKIDGSGDGANLYDDSDEDLFPIKTEIIEQPNIITTINPNIWSTVEKDESLGNNNARTLVVALLGLLLATLLIVLIAMYAYTCLLKKGTYDLQPMPGGHIEMRPK